MLSAKWKQGGASDAADDKDSLAKAGQIRGSFRIASLDPSKKLDRTGVRELSRPEVRPGWIAYSTNSSIFARLIEFLPRPNKW